MSKATVAAKAKTSTKAKASSPVLGGVGAVLGPLVNDPMIRQALISELLKFLLGLISRAPAPAPPKTTVTAPVPAPSQPAPDFPDDVIPAPPVAGRTVATVELKIGRIQLNKERFPLAYTEDNPFGLMQPGPVMAGGKMPYASKFWLDITARDAAGHELLRPDILSMGLAFVTEHHCGETFIKGHGADPSGSAPLAGYETNDTDEIGNGITAWLSTLGFLHQMKAWPAADGKRFECWAVVAGIRSNTITLNVS